MEHPGSWRAVSRLPPLRGPLYWCAPAWGVGAAFERLTSTAFGEALSLRDWHGLSANPHESCFQRFTSTAFGEALSLRDSLGLSANPREGCFRAFYFYCVRGGALPSGFAWLECDSPVRAASQRFTSTAFGEALSLRDLLGLSANPRGAASERFTSTAFEEALILRDWLGLSANPHESCFQRFTSTAFGEALSLRDSLRLSANPRGGRFLALLLSYLDLDLIWAVYA
ncbi:hypothetical protein J22TS3_44680 [Paenibacillus sp. J22TS3]|nr:hypothetical protein J22TS3_44680 [Paenibacillus sp. J22TS3]